MQSIKLDLQNTGSIIEPQRQISNRVSQHNHNSGLTGRDSFGQIKRDQEDDNMSEWMYLAKKISQNKEMLVKPKKNKSNMSICSRTSFRTMNLNKSPNSRVARPQVSLVKMADTFDIQSIKRRSKKKPEQD